MTVLMPITSPDRLNIGPPELPRLIDASVCKKSSYGPERISRAVAEMIPAVTVPPGEFGGTSCAALAAGGAACVEMLTTTPTSRPASWPNISANGTSGGWAQTGDTNVGATIPGAMIPGATITAHNANEAATPRP